MKKILWIFLIWFVAINAFAFLAANRVNYLPQNLVAQEHELLTPYINLPTWSLQKLHPHWDEYWYLSVVQSGYFNSHEATFSNAAFFPLYPAIVSVIDVFIHNPIITGVLLSSIILLLASWMLFLLVKEFHPSISPTKTVIIMLVFPTTFFFISMYAESLFLFLSISCFYFLFRKNFWIAGVFGFLAALTRITGLLLIIPFAFELYETYKSKVIKKEAFALALIPVGTLAYFTYLAVKLDNFFLFFKAQAQWGRNFMLNPARFSFADPGTAANTILDVGFTALSIILAIYLIRNVKKSYGFYVLAVLFVAVSTGTVTSINRIVLVLFPLFIALAHIKSENGKLAWMLPSTLLLGFYTMLFVQGYWAG